MTGDEVPVRLEPFGRRLPTPSHELAQLHIGLFDQSPATLLGPHFLEDFYYRVLPDAGLIYGCVARQGDRAVGLVVVTPDANGFLTVAVKRHWGKLAKVMVRHPPNPKRVYEALQVTGDRHGQRNEALGEILSLGVLAPEAGGPVSSKVRRRLARQLVDAGVDLLEDVPVVALVDETNVAARLLYNDLGWQDTDRLTKGWAVPQIVFRREPSQADEGPAAASV